jgi:uncharacterized membrane protein YphA (DoxX/SURF4 family)
LIDGDRKLCTLTAEYLAPFGFALEFVHTGKRGAARVAAESWHAVILDTILPDLDGFEVLRSMPWLEIAGGAALALGIWRAGATFLLSGTLVVFFIAITSTWARSRDIECGCFGHSTNRSRYPILLLIDAALFAALCITIRRSK